MARRPGKTKRHKPKTILRFPDLEQSKNAVVNSLAAASSQESYGHAIDEFIGWYCSEPRLAFNRTVVLRYRFFLEQKNLAPSTINVRLAAVRRLAYEASDSGLLSPELAAGIRRVKGAKRLGTRIGNWLTADAFGEANRIAGFQPHAQQARFSSKRRCGTGGAGPLVRVSPCSGTTNAHPSIAG
jgi:hypothetical protein